MSIHLSKFGKIADATIELNGLTVIAGRNDTGKSTIGKALYSLIKSIKDFPQLYVDMIQQRAYVDLIHLVFELLKSYKGPKENPLYKQLLEMRSATFSLDILSGILSKSKNIEQYLEIVNQYIDSEDVDSDLKEKVYNIASLLHREASDSEKFSSIVFNIFGKNFKRQFKNSVTKENAVISYSIGQNEIAKIQFDEDVRPEGFLDVEHQSTSFSDATLIESPLYLEESHKSEMSFAEDLKKKINLARKRFSETDNNIDIISKISQLLEDAEFEYADKQDEWWKYTVQKGAEPLFIENIASGAKSIGILYILLKTGILTSDSLLILDEPENHLHPAWQIQYANILVAMVAAGFHIILTSHSPTFIHALAKYSNDYIKDDSKINFYLAEKIPNTNYSKIEQVNGDINKIFENLTSPDDVLYFG